MASSAVTGRAPRPSLIVTLRSRRSRRGGGWNWVGVVSGLRNPNDSGVGALEWRPRHDQRYHDGGGCGRRLCTHVRASVTERSRAARKMLGPIVGERPKENGIVVSGAEAVD
jgi:hypothetical protein